MFRRNKENKAKLEHKLYLAREAPEPIFDLSECDLRNVPQGIYSLCRVFLKEVLRLDRNCLSSLSGGGQLKDLLQLKVLDLHDNAFVYLPDDIQLLKNLRELYVNDNQLKKLPETICNLSNLVILNVANNSLKALPVNIGNLKHLKLLSVNANKHLKHLPKSICKARRLTVVELDAGNFIYPPAEVAGAGAEAIMRYICNGNYFVATSPPFLTLFADIGVEYVGPHQAELLDDSDVKDYEDSRDQVDAFE
ncbi:E3 ubiquitin-protein ligase LRSAM1-like, partial [Asbolus verrucosus]